MYHTHTHHKMLFIHSTSETTTQTNRSHTAHTKHSRTAATSKNAEDGDQNNALIHITCKATQFSEHTHRASHTTHTPKRTSQSKCSTRFDGHVYGGYHTHIIVELASYNTFNTIGEPDTQVITSTKTERAYVQRKRGRQSDQSPCRACARACHGDRNTP